MRLRNNLAAAQKETQQFAAEEKSIREENLRLQRKLQMEVERREALCRHLSESESSLEMEEERLYNESLLGFNNSSGSNLNRQRTISSPIPHSPSSSRPISPGGTNFPARCCTCGQILVWKGFSITKFSAQIYIFLFLNIRYQIYMCEVQNIGTKRLIGLSGF